MKNHYKRLLKFSLLLLLAAVITGNVFYPLFATDAGSLAGGTAYLGEGTPGTGRVFSAEDWEKPGDRSVIIPLPESFRPAIENEQAILYYREDTGEIALKRKDADTIWYSNPQDRAGESMLTGRSKEALGAQLSLTYFTENGQEGQMDSWNDCAVYGGLSSERKQNKLTVTYQFGRTKVTLSDLPAQMSAERFDGFLEQSDEETKEGLLDYYTLISRAETSEKTLAKLAEKYPAVLDHDLYYLKIAGNKTITEKTLRKIKGYWDHAGYTPEDLDLDNEENGVESETAVQPKFRFVMEYELDGQTLTVKIDTKQMEYEENIPPYRLNVLEYFGAGGKEDEGYLFYPDGSGALIYFNNGRTNGSRIVKGCYGNEEIISQTSHYQTEEGIKLPVFGIQKGKEALFSEITSGASKAELIGYVSGLVNSYNCVSPAFTLVTSKLIKVTEEVKSSGIVMTEENPYNGTFELRYTPLNGENSGYSGMARCYRQRLLDTGILKQKEISETLPLVATFLGGVTADQTVVGLTVKGMEELTDYRAAGEIASDLKAAGVAGLAVRYIGWFNGGIDQTWAGRVAYAGTLGGKREFNRLCEQLGKEGTAFYPEVNFLEFGAAGKGFRTSSMNIRGLNRDILVGCHYDAMNRYRNPEMGSLYRLKPSLLQTEVTAFLSRYPQKEGISLGDLGRLAGTDFDRKTPTDREESILLNREAAERLAEGRNIMVSNPNLYLLPYASVLTDVPTEDSYSELVDEAVPFYQMVVRGSMDYTGKPLNYSSDYRTAYLQAVEYGAGLHYLLMEKQPAAVKKTQYRYYYTGAWQEWKETIVRDYGRAAGVMDCLQGVEIIRHERISNKVFLTEYKNGAKVYVNYGDEAAEPDGVTVGAKDFTVTDGRKSQNGKARVTE